MKMKRTILMSVLAFFSLSLVAHAGSKARLIYGESWSRAGREIKKLMMSSEFKREAGSDFTAEFCDESGGRASKENLGVIKLPAILLISEKGNCYCVLENIPMRISAEQLVNNFRKVDAVRRKAEAKVYASDATADDCGKFLFMMERYVGGSSRRIVSKGYYPDVFEKLKKLDPKDELAWARHFTMGDGIDLVTKANDYREKKDFTGGAAFIDNIKKLPRKRLTKEQQQGILMAEFALYREDASKKEEMLNLLRKVAEYDETTFWGTAAVGWLNSMGEPVLSTYFGWRKGDFKGSMKQLVKYGVDYKFPKAGLYTLTFACDDSSSEKPKFEEVDLLMENRDKTDKDKKYEVALTLKNPIVEGNSTTFEFQLEPRYRKRIKAMLVKGMAGTSGYSSGKISIVRRVLRPRKEVSTGSVPSIKKTVVSNYIVEMVGEDTIKEIAKKEKGAAFLKKFFENEEWQKEFAGSGIWNPNPWRDLGNGEARLADDKRIAAKAFKALDLLMWHDKGGFMETPMGRRIATAFALNYDSYGAQRCDDAKLVEFMECYREWAADGTLIDHVKDYDTVMWRQTLGFGQNRELSVADLRWSHEFANLDAPRYHGLCWVCNYRLFNCFGASVHGPLYYRPWGHRWLTQELRYRVGAVCGGISKFGSFCASAHGIPSYTAGQPVHCAYMLWNYDATRWDIAYSVTGHTGAHYTLGGPGFSAAEEVTRYYTAPQGKTSSSSSKSSPRKKKSSATVSNRALAEEERWKGNYEAAMEAAHGNWQAAEEWLLHLQSKNAPIEEWHKFGEAVLNTFTTSPVSAWVLYNKYVARLDGRTAKLDAVKKGLEAFQEYTAPTVEDPYFDEVLDTIAKNFAGDEKALWTIFKTALDGQAKTKTFHRQTLAWGSDKLMKDNASSLMFMKLVAKNAKETGAKVDYNGMIQAASQNENVAMFQQVYRLMEKLSPDQKPKLSGKNYPTEKNGGQLLSQDGLLKVSTSNGYALNYRYALDEKGYNIPNAFHTNGEEGPHAIVKLAGETTITAITVVNAGVGPHNPRRQLPLCIWVSDDGQEWSRQVYKSNELKDEWECVLATPQKAKFVKVGRDPSSGNKDVFHLKKILVYGIKQY